MNSPCSDLYHPWCVVANNLLVDVGIELLENISRRFEDDFQDFFALKGWLDLFLIVRFFLIL